MHRLRAWGLSAAFAAGTAAPAGLAADPPSGSKPWYARLTGGSKPSAPLPKLAEAPPAAPRPPAGPLSPETLADALKAEQDAYLRRLDVCTKLRQVGVAANDDKLLEQADGLEQQATALYHQRTARLGVRGGPKGSYNAVPLAAPPASVARTAEDTLDRKLGAATDPLAAAKPAKDAKPATAQARDWKVVPE